MLVVAFCCCSPLSSGAAENDAQSFDGTFIQQVREERREGARRKRPGQPGNNRCGRKRLVLLCCPLPGRHTRKGRGLVAPSGSSRTKEERNSVKKQRFNGRSWDPEPPPQCFGAARPPRCSPVALGLTPELRRAVTSCGTGAAPCRRSPRPTRGGPTARTGPPRPCGRHPSTLPPPAAGSSGSGRRRAGSPTRPGQGERSRRTPRRTARGRSASRGGSLTGRRRRPGADAAAAAGPAAARLAAAAAAKAAAAEAEAARPAARRGAAGSARLPPTSEQPGGGPGAALRLPTSQPAPPPAGDSGWRSWEPLRAVTHGSTPPSDDCAHADTQWEPPHRFQWEPPHRFQEGC